VASPLHKAFLEKGSSPLYPSITASLQNLADLFTAAQMFALGGQLYHKSPSLSSRAQEFKPSFALRNLHMPPSIPVLFTRFIIMPAFCISIVALAARSHLSWLRDDPMLYFVLMICPSGPSALLMASLTQLVGVDEGEVAWFLVISVSGTKMMRAILC
jgi:auxin efflux carrier family protein